MTKRSTHIPDIPGRSSKRAINIPDIPARKRLLQEVKSRSLQQRQREKRQRSRRRAGPIGHWWGARSADEQAKYLGYAVLALAVLFAVLT